MSGIDAPCSIVDHEGAAEGAIWGAKFPKKTTNTAQYLFSCGIELVHVKGKYTSFDIVRVTYYNNK